MAAAVSLLSAVSEDSERPTGTTSLGVDSSDGSAISVTDSSSGVSSWVLRGVLSVSRLRTSAMTASSGIPGPVDRYYEISCLGDRLCHCTCLRQRFAAIFCDFQPCSPRAETSSGRRRLRQIVWLAGWVCLACVTPEHGSWHVGG